MGADLRQQMARHLYAVHGCDGGSLLPAGNTANPGRIGHDEIGRPAGDSHLHCLRSVKVLSDLQRGSQRPDKSAIARPVVVADRLLYPRDPLAIERPAAIEGLIDCQRSEEHTSALQSLMRILYAVIWLKK